MVPLGPPRVTVPLRRVVGWMKDPCSVDDFCVADAGHCVVTVLCYCSVHHYYRMPLVLALLSDPSPESRTSILRRQYFDITYPTAVLETRTPFLCAVPWP